MGLYYEEKSDSDPDGLLLKKKTVMTLKWSPTVIMMDYLLMMNTEWHSNVTFYQKQVLIENKVTSH